MTGYNFAHTSTHSEKGNSASLSVSDALNEAGREPDDCYHVDDPKPPMILYGVHPSDLLPEVEAIIAARKKEIRAANKGRPKSETTKNIRADTHVLTSWVYSYPATPEEIASNPKVRAEYEKWEADAVRSIRADAKRRGIELKSAVRHDDERFAHIHAFGISRENDRLDAKEAHPGYIAKKAHLSEGKTGASRAYNDAMRSWQDQVFKESGLTHGLTRMGPGRRRLPTQTWNAEKRTAEVTAKAIAEQWEKIAVADGTLSKRARNLEAAKVVIEAYSDGLIEGAQTSSTGDKSLKYAKALKGAEKRSLIKKIKPIFEWAWLSVQKWTEARRKELAKHAADIEKMVRAEIKPQLNIIDQLHAEAKELVAAGSKISRDIEAAQNQLGQVRERVKS